MYLNSILDKSKLYLAKCVTSWGYCGRNNTMSAERYEAVEGQETNL